MNSHANHVGVIGPSKQTRGAADYLTTNGLRTSPSLLEKLRSRGPDDPRDHGPDFFRTPAGTCLYPVRALDRYLEHRLAALKFRGGAEQPANFRRISP